MSDSKSDSDSIKVVRFDWVVHGIGAWGGPTVNWFVPEFNIRISLFTSADPNKPKPPKKLSVGSMTTAPKAFDWKIVDEWTDCNDEEKARMGAELEAESKKNIVETTLPRKLAQECLRIFQAQEETRAQLATLETQLASLVSELPQ
jgi:hypothetical protein